MNPLCSQFQGFHRSSGFAHLHGPCVSSSRVSSDPVYLPVSTSPVLAVPGFPQIQWICQYPWTLCSQFQGFPQIQRICQYPWTLCYQFKGFHRSNGFASIHGPCVHSSRVSTDPVDLPVSMNPVFTSPGFPQIQWICQSPWTLC